MKIDFTALPGDREAYTIDMQEDDGESITTMGTVSRVSGDQWSFTPDGQSFALNDDGDDSVRATITAATLEELKIRFAARVKRIELKPDRLRSEVMCGYGDTVLMNALHLAAHTDSLPGFIESMANTMAHMIDKHIKPEEREGFIDVFTKQVSAVREENADRAKRTRTLSASLSGLLDVLKSAGVLNDEQAEAAAEVASSSGTDEPRH